MTVGLKMFSCPVELRFMPINVDFNEGRGETSSSLLVTLLPPGCRRGRWQKPHIPEDLNRIVDLIIHLEKRRRTRGENCIPNMDKWIGVGVCTRAFICFFVFDCLCLGAH